MKSLFYTTRLFVITAIGTLALRGAEPILEFKFNTPNFQYAEDANLGSGGLSTGSSPLKIGFRNGLGGGPPRGIGQVWYVSGGSFYTRNGEGVSGLAADWAYQNDTAASDMGDLNGVPSDSQGAAIAEVTDPNLADLEQITICGWYYARGSEPLRNYARLLSNLAAGSGFELRSPSETAGLLELRLNEGAVTSPAVYTGVEEWVFFAVTYDSLMPEAAVQFYIGGKSADVSAAGGSLALAQGPVGAGTRLTIGNAPGNGTRGFSGNFDNIRVYGQALTLEALQAIRAADLGPQVNLPLPPSGLTATVQSATAVYLEWTDNSADETFFEVVRMQAGQPVSIRLAQDTTSYLDAGLTPDTEYTYTVASGLEAGQIPPFQQVTVATPPLVSDLPMVANIRIKSKSSISATLAWDDVATGEAGYIVERMNPGGVDWETMRVLPANAQEASFSNLSNANLQRFRVFAYNGEVESAPAEIVFELRDREFSIGGIKAFSIDESLVTRIVHVDPVNGNDANDGATLATAMRTITKAFQQAGIYNKEGEGTRILLQPGIYQEGRPEDNLQTQPMIGIGSGSWGDPGMPIILEGQGWDAKGVTGDVIIQGSNRYSNWRHIGDNVYEHSWTIDWGVDPTYPFPGSPVGTRSFHGVNVRPQGDRYWQMYYHMAGPNDPNIDTIESHEGYFWVDEAADFIRVKAPQGVDLTDPSLEVNVNERHRLFQFFQATGSTGTKSQTPLVIRNIVFRHGYRGPFLQNVGGAIVEDCSFENIKLFGFSYNGSFPGFVLRRCDFIRNGHSGGGIDGVMDGQSDYLMEDLYFLENGRQAAVTRFRGHFESQIKLADMNGATLRDFHMVGAQGVGLWLDTGLSNFETYNGIIEGGITAAVFIENNNRNNIINLGDQLTVYARDLWLRDGVFDKTTNNDNTKGVQTAESENWIADNLWIEGQALPFNFAYNNRGDLVQNTIKNTVVVQETGKAFYFGTGETWQQAFDTFIPAFAGNRYYGGSSQGFLNRAALPVGFEDWVLAVNNNPAHTVTGIEEGSLWLPEPSDARPTLGVYPTSREIREGDSIEKALLVTRLGASLESPLTVELRYSSGTGNAQAADFEQLPGQVTIPAGAMSAYVPLKVLSDGQSEGLEMLEVQVLETTVYEVLAAPARIRIIDQDTDNLPLFKLTALSDRLYENLDQSVKLRILREGTIEGTVSLSLQSIGDAIVDVDYQIEPAAVVFGANDYERIIEVRPLKDLQIEGLEIIELELTQENAAEIVIAAPSTVKIELNDNDGVVAEKLEIIASEGATQSSLLLSNPSTAATRYTFNWGSFNLFAEGSEVEGGPSASEFVDISEVGQKSSWSWFFPNDDGFAPPIELPWSFYWFGQEYDSIQASSNGFIVFGRIANAFSRYADPVLLPLNVTATPSNSLMFAWADLKLSSNSGLFYAQVSDTFILQWDKFTLNGQTVTVQLQFQEGNVVTAVYKDWPSGEDVLVGYQNSTKELGGTFIPLAPLPSVPYALRFSAAIPILNSQVASVDLAPGASERVDFNVYSQGLSLGENLAVLELNSSLGHQADQRLPIHVLYTQNPLLRDMGSDLLQLEGDWGLVAGLGWMYTPEYPFIYSADLGWLFKVEGVRRNQWYSVEWDSGWMYADPAWYPSVYFYQNGQIGGQWGYVLPGEEAIWVWADGSGWLVFPRN